MNITLARSINAPYIWIQGELPDTVIKTLDTITSYEDPQHLHSEAYLMGTWDGRWHLLKRARNGSHYFPAGLINSVVRVLMDYGYNVKYEDKREIPKSTQSFDWHGPELREYQQRQILAAMEEFSRREGCILEMATGSGKTTCALNIIKRIGVQTLVLVHTRQLLNQWKKEVKNQLSTSPGIYAASERNIRPITIAMIQTLSKHIMSFPRTNFEMVIQDECHHAPANMFFKTIMNFNSYYRLGLTATPTRNDNAMPKMIGGLGPIIKTVSVNDLINDGFLVRPIIKFLRAPPVTTSARDFATAYRMGIIENRTRNELIAHEARKIADNGKSVLIVVNQVAHGKLLKNMISKSIFLQGIDDDAWREVVLDAFRKKATKILISTIMDEGADIRSMDAVILASAGKSPTKTIQRIGRALRTSPGKESATIIDFSDTGKWLREHSQERRRVIEETFGGMK